MKKTININPNLKKVDVHINLDIGVYLEAAARNDNVSNLCNDFLKAYYRINNPIETQKKEDLQNERIVLATKMAEVNKQIAIMDAGERSKEEEYKRKIKAGEIIEI